MAVLDDIRGFDIGAASVSLWVFKGPRGAAESTPTYTGHWVETTEELDAALRQTVQAERDRIEEVLEYGLLAQNNEASALLIGKEETNAGLLTDLVAAENDSKRVQDAERLRNTTFSLIKLTHGQTILYAIRRTTNTWKTARQKGLRHLFFDEHRLGLDTNPRFDLETAIDFFIFGDHLLILHKAHFESTLRYKAAHANDFLELQGDPAFSNTFVSLSELIQHVGSNKLHLRRMSAVRQKAHFRNAQFMELLRRNHIEYGFTFSFSEDGRIILTQETSPQIITALLDHRLSSGFSGRIYDVPNAVAVSVTANLAARQIAGQ